MRHKRLPTNVYLALCGLTLSYVIWSAASPVIKLTLGYIPPFTFLFLRFLIVCLVLLPYTIYQLSKHRVSKKDYSNLLLLGLFSQSSLVLIFLGLGYTTAIDSAFIGTIGPLLSVAAGHYFYKDKANLGLKIGVLLATLGTALIVVEPILVEKAITTTVTLRILGNILVIAYNLAFLLYIIWSKISLGQNTVRTKKILNFIHMKPMENVYPSGLLMSLAFYVGLFSMIPFAIMENLGYFGEVNYDLLNLELTPVLGLLFMSLLSSIVAYFAFEGALKKVTISDTAILAYMQTIFTIPFAYVLLGELPSNLVILGGIIIASGVVVAEWSLHLEHKG